MQISPFLVFGFSFHFQESFFVKTLGLLLDLICLADTTLLLRCYCSANACKFPRKFLSFLNYVLPPSSKDMSGQIYCLCGGNCCSFCLFYESQKGKINWKLISVPEYWLFQTPPFFRTFSEALQSYLDASVWIAICDGGWISDLPVDILILFTHYFSLSRASEPNVNVGW